MNAMMDHLMSTLIAGVLALTVARVQVNINSMVAQNQHRVSTQSYAVELARQLEFDLSKIGYNVAAGKILFADSTRLSFRADMDRIGTPRMIGYVVGQTTECASTANPRDVPLYRGIGSAWIRQNFGVTRLRFAYFDSSFQRISAPGSDPSLLRRIRAVRVSFVLQSPDPVYSSSDTTWAEVTWEKTILPRNLLNQNS